jgi:phenylacetate-CoA ligase
MRSDLRAASDALYSRIVFPAVLRLRGEGAMFADLEELEQLQWRAPQDLAERQTGRLIKIIDYAQRTSPFYRTRLSPLLPLDRRTICDRITETPLVTKADLQSFFRQMAADPAPRRVSRKTTGGSTGQAVTLLKDRRSTASEMAASWLGYGWFGIKPGDRSARFWGSPSVLKRRLRSLAADAAMNRVRFSAFAFDDHDLEGYWSQCLRFRPSWFYGYVSMLEAFAMFVARRGYDGRSLDLRAIVTTSEVLSAPQRALLIEVFGAPVQNEYGCGEVGPIAYECPRGGFHMMTEGLFVEILKPNGDRAAPGESGQIVVTDLNNRAMPLIRYALGDMAERGDTCSCGRGFPTLARVWGREYDFVFGPDGRKYHGEFFMYVFEDVRAKGVRIAQFQVIQSELAKLDVLVVPEPGTPFGAIADALSSEFAARIPSMRVAIREVASVPRKASGKQHVIVNQIAGASKGTSPSES